MQKLHVSSSGYRDFGVALKFHLGSQASSPVKAKNSALLEWRRVFLGAH